MGRIQQKIPGGETDGLKIIIELKHCKPNHSIIISVAENDGIWYKKNNHSIKIEVAEIFKYK